MSYTIDEREDFINYMKRTQDDWAVAQYYDPNQTFYAEYDAVVPDYDQMNRTLDQIQIGVDQNPPEVKPIGKIHLYEIPVLVSNTILRMIRDLATMNGLDRTFFTRENRLFVLGILSVVLSLFLFIFP